MSKDKLIKRIQESELSDNSIAKLQNTLDLLIEKDRKDRIKFPHKIEDEKRSQLADFDALGEK